MNTTILAQGIGFRVHHNINICKNRNMNRRRRIPKSSEVLTIEKSKQQLHCEQVNWLNSASHLTVEGDEGLSIFPRFNFLQGFWDLRLRFSVGLNLLLFHRIAESSCNFLRPQVEPVQCARQLTHWSLGERTMVGAFVVDSVHERQEKDVSTHKETQN